MGRGEKAFDRCYEKHYTAILCYGISRGMSRADAEEIASEAFVRLWDRWEEMGARDETAVKKWLYVTAGHIVREYRRRTAPTVPLEELESVLTDGEAEGPLEEEQFRHYLRQIERTLGERDWELFRLAFLERLPYEELMVRLSLRADVLRARIHRLRKRLRTLLPRLFCE